MDNSNPIKFMTGYVTVRPFGGMSIPVPIQNMILRNYCAGFKAQYILPMNEHKFDDCYMQFFATIAAAQEGAHIILCSSSMLPQSPFLYAEAKQRILEKKLTIHFIFDNLKIDNEQSFEDLESVIKLRSMTDYIDNHAHELREFLTAYI